VSSSKKASTTYNKESTLWATPGSQIEVSREAITAHNPARLSPSDPARTLLKPLGFVDTETLDEIIAIFLLKVIHWRNK